MYKNKVLSTEVFTGKTIPDFIRIHPFFRNQPLPIRKIFPALGLPNYQEETNIDKCLIDIRKEGSYVWNFMKAIHLLILKAQSDLNTKVDKLQFLSDDSITQQTKISNMFQLVDILHNVSLQLDPNDKNVIARSIVSVEGKINLYLIDNITDGNGKVLFKCGQSILKVYNALYEKLAEFDVFLQKIDNTKEFKVFCAENIPNRKYTTVFSSDGKDGAWDLLTMAMRGIKSCQRWDYEASPCLIGSILSRFIGIIYLTSGVEAETNPAYGTAVSFSHSIGTKMMRRCIVRYVYDRDEEKPYILLDKMYPEMDRDILDAFIASIRKRCKLEIYYAPDLVSTNRLKHIYMPSDFTNINNIDYAHKRTSYLKARSEWEKSNKNKPKNEKSKFDLKKPALKKDIIDLRVFLEDHEWSYQDVPIKSKDDLAINYLNNHKEEVERDVKAFEVNLSLWLASSLELVYNNQIIVDDEIRRTIKNLRINTSFATFSDHIVRFCVGAYKAPSSIDAINNKIYYKNYLRQFLINRMNILTHSKKYIIKTITDNTSRKCDIDKFQEFMMTTINRFVKDEIKKLIQWS